MEINTKKDIPIVAEEDEESFSTRNAIVKTVESFETNIEIIKETTTKKHKLLSLDNGAIQFQVDDEIKQHNVCLPVLTEQPVSKKQHFEKLV